MRLILPAMHRGNLARDISVTLIGQSICAVVNTNQDTRSMQEICLTSRVHPWVFFRELVFDSIILEVMAEKRIVLVALDGSKNADFALNCEYKIMF